MPLINFAPNSAFIDNSQLIACKLNKDNYYTCIISSQYQYHHIYSYRPQIIHENVTTPDKQLNSMFLFYFTNVIQMIKLYRGLLHLQVSVRCHKLQIIYNIYCKRLKYFFWRLTQCRRSELRIGDLRANVIYGKALN